MTDILSAKNDPYKDMPAFLCRKMKKLVNATTFVSEFVSTDYFDMASDGAEYTSSSFEEGWFTFDNRQIAYKRVNDDLYHLWTL